MAVRVNPAKININVKKSTYPCSLSRQNRTEKRPLLWILMIAAAFVREISVYGAGQLDSVRLQVYIQIIFALPQSGLTGEKGSYKTIRRAAQPGINRNEIDWKAS
jgi:hypothetical protein